MYKFTIKIRSSSLKPMFTPNHWHQTVVCYQAICIWYIWSPPLHPCPPSGTIWRLTYSAALTTLTYCSDYSGPRGGVAA